MESVTSDQWKRVEDLFNQLKGVEGESREAWLRELRASGNEDQVVLSLVSDKLRIRPEEKLRRVGTVVGGYELKRLIGEGGMGVVYDANNVETGARAAVKLINPSLMATEEATRRFRKEIENQAKLSHSGIPKIFGGSIHQDPTELGGESIPYLAMEYVRGDPITKYKTLRNPELPELIDKFRRACKAIDYMHDHNVIHCDLKPAHIMIDEEGNPRVLDFGLSELLDPSLARGRKTIEGTPAYMSPEQVSEEAGEIGSWTDVYALGMILFELLAGRRPYDVPKQGSLSEIRTAILAAAPIRLGELNERYSGKLEDIVAKAIRRNPGERYQRVWDLEDVLGRYLSEIGGNLGTPTWMARKTRYLVEPYDGTSLPDELGIPSTWLGEENYRRIRDVLDWGTPVQVFGIPQSGKTLMVAQALHDRALAKKLTSSSKVGPGQKVALMLLDLNSVGSSRRLQRALMREINPPKVTSDFAVPTNGSQDQAEREDEQEPLLQAFYEWLQKRRLLLVVDNAHVVQGKDWNSGLADFKALLAKPWVRDAATCILITRDERVTPARIGYPPGEQVLPPAKPDRQELVQAWQKVLPGFPALDAELAADDVLRLELKPAQVCELLREVEEKMRKPNANITLGHVKAICEDKWLECQGIADVALHDILHDMKLGSQREDSLRRALLLMSLFGREFLPEKAFLVAGCEVGCLERLQEYAWIRAKGQRVLSLDPYLADMLQERWLDDDCPWICYEKDLLNVFRQVMDIVQDSFATTGTAAAGELLERAHASVRQTRLKMNPGALQKILARIQDELALQMLADGCDDVVLPVDANEVSRVVTENLYEVGLDALVGRFVALTRVGDSPDRLIEMLDQLLRRIVQDRPVLPAEMLRRLDYGLWRATRFNVLSENLLEIRREVISLLAEDSCVEWAWCKAAAHFCLNTIAFAAVDLGEGAEREFCHHTHALAEEFAGRLPRHPPSEYARVDNYNLQARLLELCPDETGRESRYLEACRLLYSAVKSSGAKEWCVIRLTQVACRLVREYGWVPETLQLQELVESATQQVGFPPRTVARLGEFLLELSRSQPVHEARLMMLEKASNNINKYIKNIYVKIHSKSRNDVTRLLVEIKSEQAHVWRQMGDPDRASKLMEEMLEIFRRIPEDQRSLSAWSTYLLLLEERERVATLISDESMDWSPPRAMPDEMRTAVRQATEANNAALSKGLRPHPGLSLLLLKLRWRRDGYTLRSAVVSQEKRRRGLNDSHQVVFHKLPFDVRLKGLSNVYSYRYSELNMLFNICKEVNILLQQVRLEEEYRFQLALLNPSAITDGSRALELLDHGSKRWPREKRILQARAKMLRHRWEFAEAEDAFDALLRVEHVGKFRREALDELCVCLLSRLTYELPEQHPVRQAKLDKLRDVLEELRPWPDFAPQVAAYDLRYRIECKMTSDALVLDELFDRVVGFTSPYCEQVVTYLRDGAAPAKDDSFAEYFEHVMFNDSTNLCLLRSMGWAYYRRSQLMTPDILLLWRSFKAFDAVRLLEKDWNSGHEKSWNLGHPESIATCMGLGVVVLSAISLARGRSPFQAPPADGSSDWLDYAESKLHSAMGRSIGRCRTKVLDLLREAARLRRET